MRTFTTTLLPAVLLVSACAHAPAQPASEAGSAAHRGPPAAEAPAAAADLGSVPACKDTLAEIPHPVDMQACAPSYPLALKNADREGLVRVRYVVEADGHVGPRAVTEATDRGFLPPVMHALDRCRFETEGLEGLPCVVSQTFTFRIAEDAKPD